MRYAPLTRNGHRLEFRLFRRRENYANDQSTGTEKPGSAVYKEQVSSSGEMLAQAGRLSFGADDAAEKAEFRTPKDHPGATFQWKGSYRVHTGRGAFLAGTLHCADSRRSCSGLAGCSVSSRTRNARLHRCRWAKAGTKPIWREEKPKNPRKEKIGRKNKTII